MVSLLLDYCDGSLPEARADEFRHHLCGCLPCYIYLQTYQETIRLTHELPDVPLPEELESRLKQMLEVEMSRLK
jgi:anti-sigma factor RsiW